MYDQDDIANSDDVYVVLNEQGIGAGATIAIYNSLRDAQHRAEIQLRAGVQVIIEQWDTGTGEYQRKWESKEVKNYTWA